MRKIPIILIAGGSCSGKSEFTKWFKNAIVVSLDSYYLPLEKIGKDQNGDYDFDTPDALDIKACAMAVKQLAKGLPAEIPVYSMLENARVGTKRMKPTKRTKFIVVEGMQTFFSPLRELGDIKIFLDTPTEARIARRIIRDVRRKGRSPIDIMTNFVHAEKRYKELVEPTKKYADMIIPFSYNPVKF